MSLLTLEHARRAAHDLVETHPILRKYLPAISSLVVGSIPAGLADEFSDVDVWVVCPTEHWTDIAENLRAYGERPDPPPNDFRVGDVAGHYFLVPLGKIQDGLETLDDGTLFIMTHSLVAHDPHDTLSHLLWRYTPIPLDIVRRKVEDGHSLLRQAISDLPKLLKRDQPLAVLEAILLIARRACQLCCWLDGRAPTDRANGLLRQAQRCSTGPVLVSAVKDLLAASGHVVVPLSVGADDHPLAGCSLRLQTLALQSVSARGFRDLPVWHP